MPAKLYRPADEAKLFAQTVGQFYANILPCSKFEANEINQTIHDLFYIAFSDKCASRGIKLLCGKADEATAMVNVGKRRYSEIRHCPQHMKCTETKLQ